MMLDKDSSLKTSTCPNRSALRCSYRGLYRPDLSIAKDGLGGLYPLPAATGMSRRSSVTARPDWDPPRTSIRDRCEDPIRIVESGDRRLTRSRLTSLDVLEEVLRQLRAALGRPPSRDPSMPMTGQFRSTTMVAGERGTSPDANRKT